MTTRPMAAFCCVIAAALGNAGDQVLMSASEELVGTGGTGAVDSSRQACDEDDASSRARPIAAIPRPTGVVGADEEYFRVKCTSGGPSCAVFLECRDQDQAADCFFAQLDAIEDKGTVRLSQDDLADILGVPDWPERLSCKLLSNDPVEVQVLVRFNPILHSPQTTPLHSADSSVDN